MKPNLFIVGAAKAGTTALHSILNSHPEVYMSPVKEPNFFSKDIVIEDFAPEFKKKFQNLKIEKKPDGSIVPIHQAYIQDRKTYLNLFKKANQSHLIIGEASVSYLYSQVAAKEIFKFNPEAKLIIILREPIERAFSHYLMDLRVGRVKNRNFVTAVKDDLYYGNGKWEDAHLYIQLGLYSDQIKRYLQVFPREKILLIEYNEFRSNNLAVLQSIIKFLGISDFSFDSNHNKNSAMLPKNKMADFILNSSMMKFLKRFFPLNKNLKKKIKSHFLSGKDIPHLSEAEREKLQSFFVKDIQELQELTNMDLSSWNNKNLEVQND